MILDEVVYRLIKDVNIKELIRNYYRSDFERGWAMSEAHSHIATEIDYVMDGTAYYKFDKEIVKISKNNILLILPNIQHKLFVEYDCKLMHISLNLNQIINTEINNQTTDGSDSLIFSDSPFIDIGYLKINDDSSLNDSMKEIVFELENKDIDCELLVKVIISKLLIKLKRIISNKNKHKGNIQSEYIEKAINYIVLSLSNDLTPEIISNAIHISCDYLKHIFKKHTGYSVMNFVYNKRIELSKQLLNNHCLKISDIAVDVGINNFQYFSTLFKKHTGVTPSKFRKINQSTDYNNSLDGKNY